MVHRSAPLIAFRPGFYSPRLGEDDRCTEETSVFGRTRIPWRYTYTCRSFFEIFSKITTDDDIPLSVSKPQISINGDGHSLSQTSIPPSMHCRQPGPHQCCIGSFLITFAVRLDTGWWIMAPTGPHLGDVSLVFPCEVCRWLHRDTKTNTNTHTGRKTTNRSPAFEVPALKVSLIGAKCWTALPSARHTSSALEHCCCSIFRHPKWVVCVNRQTGRKS